MVVSAAGNSSCKQDTIPRDSRCGALCSSALAAAPLSRVAGWKFPSPALSVQRCSSSWVISCRGGHTTSAPAGSSLRSMRSVRSGALPAGGSSMPSSCAQERRPASPSSSSSPARPSQLQRQRLAPAICVSRDIARGRGGAWHRSDVDKQRSRAIQSRQLEEQGITSRSTSHSSPPMPFNLAAACLQPRDAAWPASLEADKCWEGCWRRQLRHHIYVCRGSQGQMAQLGQRRQLSHGSTVGHPAERQSLQVRQASRCCNHLGLNEGGIDAQRPERSQAGNRSACLRRQPAF